MTIKKKRAVARQRRQQAKRRRTIWTILRSLRKSLWYGFWIGVGLTPIGAHIISQFYCGTGEVLRCAPIEFPAWMEAAGIAVALIFANAHRNIVSKSAKQLGEAAKGWLPWKKVESSTPRYFE